jgi:purine-nucleoside phosphorylase
MLRETLRFIRKSVSARPKIGVVLGSGLGDFAETLREPNALATSSIPHFPRSTVAGHRGRLLFGSSGGAKICVLEGRVHLYEHGDVQSILYPVRILRRLGVRILVLTNAAGGVNRAFTPGDLMLITDHVNLTFERSGGRPSSPPVYAPWGVYDREISDILTRTALRNGIPLKTGVYCGLLGPSYETAAEVEMVRRLGCDAAGMSTVNEAALAASLGMRVAGLSCITNLSTGASSVGLTHDDVMEVARRSAQSFSLLLREAISEMTRATGRHP